MANNNIHIGTYQSRWHSLTPIFKTGLFTVLFTAISLAPAIAGLDKMKRLKAFSLEELTQVEVTIAGKTPQKLSDIPAAVYVVSQEDIKNSGATNIPELLRMVPGLHVARIDANKWIVSSRGFSDRFTNKLLVMIDGRSIYSPLFSGVLWEQQDVVLADIDRIEVIRNPGAAVWGANAVNGVINIISKQAKETQGRMLSTTVGSEQNIATFREGSELSFNSHLRTYAKYRYQDESVDLAGEDASDDLRDIRAGFRADWQDEETDSFTFQGDFNAGKTSERISVLDPTSTTFSREAIDEIEFTSGHLMGRWETQYTNSSDGELKIYLEQSDRTQWVLSEKRTTFDLNYKYHSTSFDGHDLITGMGYRYSSDKQRPGNLIVGEVRAYNPTKNIDRLYSAFLQDDITLVEDHWWLTLGSKLEHNDYTGYEAQPNIRLRWRPDQRHIVWGAISRAVRTPSRSEQGAFIALRIIDEGPPPVAILLQGSDDYGSEKLTAYELGYRFEPQNNFNLDASLFYNDYDDLRSIELLRVEAAPPPLSGIGTIVTSDNKASGETYGFELSAYWRPNEKWRLRANYSFLEMQLKTQANSTDSSISKTEKLSPEHQFNLLTSYQIQENLRLNAFGRYVSELAAADVDEYVDLDIGLQWQISNNLELSFYGRNLLHDEHQEGTPTFFLTPTTAVEREFYTKLVWNF